ncbi:hypothetical protein DEU56DRAFT_973482 [Suillus clintonianus]|uniref:uncharacterized protein n=1 Tax=Suillus clintonianus TaxID=1904413 RepID=UPI001B87A906|nr:uncharacterized protein DEU56DRAFT_973482 [Suillus clintonianus]KAG2129909.1 hypothetical protein DEU56DRAFT_973482 [Suillus clintonianus]
MPSPPPLHHYLPTPPMITPTPSSSPQSQIVIQLNTILTIAAADFPHFYPSDLPTQAFQPVYNIFNDGSLVAPPFFDDLCTTYLALVIIACLFTVFARNIYTSIAFIWSGKVRKKSLLYTVFFSQLLAIPALLPLLIAQFHPAFDCQLILRVTVASGGISLSLLVRSTNHFSIPSYLISTQITGILGVKAYRCLDNSRLVLVVLAALRSAALVLLALDLVSLRSHRSLAGRCYRPSDSISYAFIILLFVESFFVCLCFLYAVWKSNGSAAVRGRITVSLSLDDVADPPLDTRKESIESHKTANSRRGWWDYVSTVDHPGPLSPRSRRTQSLTHDPTILMGARDGLFKFRTGERVRDAENVPSRPPLPTEFPLTRTSTVRVSTTIPNIHNDALPIPRRSSSPAVSSISRISRYMPRVKLFREVMRDELFYTTFITASTVTSVIMTIVGVNSAGPADHVAWMGFDWVLISYLVMHSFGRVIRRHETEALLQQPSTWHRNVRANRTTAELDDGRVRANRSSFGRSFQVRTRHCPITRRHDAAEGLCDPSTRYMTTSHSPRGDTNVFSLHRVDTRNNTALPTHPPTPEVDYFPSDSSSCHRSDTKHAEENILGYRYDDSLPSLPPRPHSDDQHSFQASPIVI